MPVYHFTIHAYRSWNADHPRGFVQRGKGVLPPNPRLAKSYDRLASESPVRFKESHWQTLLWIANDACSRRQWRLHALAWETSHMHLLVSWRNETPQTEVIRKVKNLMSRELNRRLSPRRKHWFSRSGSRRRVTDDDHFDYLVNAYLPSHRGLVWSEGESIPEPPDVCE